MRTMNRLGGAAKAVSGAGLALCCTGGFLSGSLALAALAVPASATAAAWIGVGLCELVSGWTDD